MRAVSVLIAVAACGGSSRPATSDGSAGSGEDAAVAVDAPAEVSDLDRLLGTYLDYLQAHPGAQSNGLDGAQLASVCALWTRLAPSGQATFLTITARLEGSILEVDATPMLAHVTKLYRLVGGDGATATSPGSCGGGEFNRMMLSIDDVLHTQLRAAFDQTGGTSQRRVIVDVDPASFWRDSHDLAGPHTPFDASDETEGDAPRGQLQYFRDPTSARASSPLGRQDLATLVDPFALEIDQDYDCTHNSNPSCEYTLYGAFCAPLAKRTGVEIYGDHYGVIDLTWRPTGC
jgi:hypothetical protein